MLNKNTFPPFKRIRTQLEFKQSFNQSHRAFGSFYILHYKMNALGYPRLGIITSKRNLKKAVQRNQARRIVREMFRLSQNQLKSLDLIIVAKKKAATAGKDELRQCLKKLFGKLLYF